MKITVINGQNHKGSTWHTAAILLDNIKCDKDVTEFFLPRDLNHFCAGCYACVEGREKCPYWEEKKTINDALVAADLIILTSPNYCMMPSAPMKAFFDLFVDFEQYVDFFYLQDLVDPNSSKIKYFNSLKDLSNVPYPQTERDWLDLYENQLDFVNRRNKRIAESIK